MRHKDNARGREGGGGRHWGHARRQHGGLTRLAWGGTNENNQGTLTRGGTHEHNQGRHIHDNMGEQHGKQPTNNQHGDWGDTTHPATRHGTHGTPLQTHPHSHHTDLIWQCCVLCHSHAPE